MADQAPGQVPVLGHVDERLRTTSLCLAVAYGARNDPAHRGGLAHLLEHLLMSAPVVGPTSLCEHVERLGGDANAETGLELMLFTAQVHASDAADVTRLLRGAVLEPRLDAAVLDRERAVVLQELAAAAADPSDVVQDTFLADVFGSHPLGRPVGGTAEEVGATSLDDVLDHHRDVFLTSPMALVVVGPDLPGATGLHRSPARRSGRGGSVPISPPPRTRPAPRWPDGFAWTCVGGRGPSATDPDRLAYVLLSNLMGSSPASLLYRRLRNDGGLAYAFQSWSRAYTEAGAWRVLAGVDVGNGEALVEVITATLEELASGGPSDEDLAAARRKAEMHLVRGSEVPAEYARLIAQRTLAGTVEWSVDQELAALREVTGAQVVLAARRVLADLCVSVAS
ncbi:pitrilysin family protein [Umezawaea sp.]|uniref:M16 family metallopeptidase n=1 Tax=Umezawaea sp. TaxID=1955258 RepID=UPI002ED5244D